ncbi:hypothetical protein GCM10007063_01530 [Lentibacillus kapialis]|uniref:Uncharacterized protein n=1 Tax=Lentibacillus kapialis TaxID=340214 RepID=A0A917PKZ2_9BACI|nr:hypothetical protein [Lentibacillus kapialis]GGJ82730.1 hypothetical protein GCM10007063_01530 [Lentibacillus kapialis]
MSAKGASNSLIIEPLKKDHAPKLFEVLLDSTNQGKIVSIF